MSGASRLWQPYYPGGIVPGQAQAIAPGQAQAIDPGQAQAIDHGAQPVAAPAMGPDIAPPDMGPGVAAPDMGPDIAPPELAPLVPWEGPHAGTAGSLASVSRRQAMSVESIYNQMKPLKSSVGIRSSYNALVNKMEKYVTALRMHNKTSYELMTMLTGIMSAANAWQNSHPAQPGAHDREAERGGLVGVLRNTVLPPEYTRLVTESPILGDLTLNLDPRSDVVGHKMTFALPVTYPSLCRARDDGTIGGLHFKYWEKITVDYQFRGRDVADVEASKQEGVGGYVKEWNDVYAGAEDTVKTFGENSTIGGLLQESRAGNLRGPKMIHIEDNPAYGASAGRYGSRLLEFRVEFFTDDGQRRELYCNQKITVENGTVTECTMNHGADADGVRFTGNVTSGTDAARFTISIPTAAKNALPDFVRNVLAGVASPFYNAEWERAAAMVNDHNSTQPAGYKPELVDEHYKSIFNASHLDSQVAGFRGIAKLHPEDQIFQEFIPGVGLLVAVKQGNKIAKLYYSTNQEKHSIARVFSVSYTGGLRHFQEIPVEWVIDPATGAIRLIH